MAIAVDYRDSVSSHKNLLLSTCLDAFSLSQKGLHKQHFLPASAGLTEKQRAV
jgi:hypothetical protein